MNGTERRDPGRKTVIGVILYAVLFFLIVALSNLAAHRYGRRVGKLGNLRKF